MEVIEPGHIYVVRNLDAGPGQHVQTITFVNREANPHPGTQTQEYIRVLVDVLEVLIDRTNHCDACLRWEGNDQIVKHFSDAQRHLRLALLLHEQRAVERSMEKGELKPEKVPTGKDGHFFFFLSPKD